VSGSKINDLVNRYEDIDPNLMDKLKKKAKKRIDSIDKMVEKSKKVSEYDMSRRTKELINSMGDDIADLY